MPKARSTCTRCSMRRQKCDRQRPCGRCVASKEAHLCTTEWTDGYDPNIHRKYPRKTSPARQQHSPNSGLDLTQPRQQGIHPWPPTPLSDQDYAPRFQPHPTSNGRHRSFSANSSIDPIHVQPTEPTPSSTNLDFITYGRNDYSNVSIGAILSNREAHLKNKAMSEQSVSPDSSRPLPHEEDAANAGGFSPAARSVEVYHIRSLIPSKTQVFQMIDYHEQCMMYWTGGIYHGPTLRKALVTAYGDSAELDLLKLDWRWTAVIFSILSASIIGSGENVSSTWGYTTSDKTRLAKQWGNATIACLQLGDYASKYHIHSIQAIMNMHQSEHLVGSTREWAVFQGAALVIARGLGLHRLGTHPDDGKAASDLPPQRREAMVQREMGRRVWYALASQDWFCSTSQGLYSIQRRHFTTTRPGYYDDETMSPITDGTPTFSHVGHYLNDVAYLVVSYHDDMLAAPDLPAKYNVVLKYDAKMRAMSNDKMPTCLSPTTPFDPLWPRWVMWTRHLHQASWAHKIIMIHQAFLAKSFKSPLYTYSRWACCNASKIIINELGHDRDPEEPQWWVEQAFVCTAGICLALDLFHRSDRDPEIGDHIVGIEKAIKTLQLWPLSSVANHGTRLLSSLLEEHKKKAAESAKTNAPTTSSLPAPFPVNMAPANLATAAADPLPQPQAGVEIPNLADPFLMNGDVDIGGFEDLMDTLPLEAGLDNNSFFESMMAVSNTQFY